MHVSKGLNIEITVSQFLQFVGHSSSEDANYYIIRQLVQLLQMYNYIDYIYKYSNLHLKY